MNNTKKTVLISTVYTQAHGGIFATLEFLVRVLREMNLHVIIAYYVPYSVKPELSVPFKKIGRQKPGAFNFVGELDVEEYAIGTFLPELEFLNYYPNAHWKKLINSADLCIAVTGHMLSATPFYLTRRKFLTWLATGYQEDRKDRVKTFSWYRKILDNVLISRIGAYFEKKLLRAGTVYAMSHYTKRSFGNAEKIIRDVISCPIDNTLFFPVKQNVQPGLICFTGRFLDPRKNIDLLFQSFSLVLKKLPYAQLCLIGDGITPEISEKLSAQGIADHVTVFPYISRADMILQLQKTDVFVIPSMQEGLCISGLEAMACGCPVVSTQCGGPSDYIMEDKNGFLVNFDAQTLANHAIRICENRILRDQMSLCALNTIRENYSVAVIEKKWMNVITQAFIAC